MEDEELDLVDIAQEVRELYYQAPDFTSLAEQAADVAGRELTEDELDEVTDALLGMNEEDGRG